MEQFKNDLALIYNQALIHYKNDKKKASDCVAAYCQGLYDHDQIQKISLDFEEGN